MLGVHLIDFFKFRMEEEEPMDISGEDNDFFNTHSALPTRFKESSKKWNSNATICSSSPTKHESRLYGRSASVDELILRQRLKQKNVEISKPLIEEMRGLNSMRSLTPKKRHSMHEPSQKTPKLVGPNHPDFKQDSKKNKEKSSLFNKRNNGTFMVWAIVILFCVIGKIYLSYNADCEMFIDFPNLEKNFDHFLFGQHIARNVSISTLSRYWEQSLSTNHTRLKPFVFSFHGWTGVGKNFVTKLILNSLHVHHYKTYLVPNQFPSSNIQSYAKDISKSIRKHIRDCRFNVFIFDEMDKAPPSLIKGLKSVLTSLKNKEFDNQWIVFIFLSNSKGSEINSFLFSQIAKGRSREDLTHGEFLSVLHQESEKEWYHDIHDKNLIDVYVPFLPLNTTHIEYCIKQDLRRKKVVPSDGLVLKILHELSFFQPPGTPVQYSLTGCKRVSDKVDLHITSVD